jgi:hypothetical protein
MQRVYGSCRILTRDFDSQNHLTTLRSVLPLGKDNWPNLGGRELWPSAPTLNELLEMSRLGVVHSPSQREECKTLSCNLREFNKNINLARGVILRNVLGIRSDAPIPKKFLGHFRYRRGFLILTNYWIPSGLARFLAAQWLTAPHNLWLRVAVPLKQYLREVPFAVIDRARRRPLPKRKEPAHYSSDSDDSDGDSLDLGYSDVEDSESSSQESPWL